jgi:predicted enzyme related to lactoylglutathione lyase
MKIVLSSVLVDDQDKALKFYTQILGFVKKTEMPAGRYRWLTVVSPDAADGAQLVLEPNEMAAAKVYQRALYDAGIAATSFQVEDIEVEYARLLALGVNFRMKPTRMGGPILATFDDTCGNWISLHQL